MMDIWEILGIDETTDEREIKRAYAKMLAKHHPEDEPEKFQEIKEAYDMALKHAKGLVKLAEFNGDFNGDFDGDFDGVKENPSSYYFDLRDSYGYEWVTHDKESYNNDSIFTNVEELDQLDELELEEKRAVIDGLIVTLKAIKEPDITVEKLERLVAEINYELLENNPYFSNFTKELKQYLITHRSFFARRQHLFAIINNRFKNLFAEAKDYDEILYGSSGDLLKLCVWLAEFEKDLKKRHGNIQMTDQKYGKSFTWDSESNRTFEQQYKRYSKGVDMRNFGQQLKNCLLIMGAVIFVGLIVVRMHDQATSPQTAVISTFPITFPDIEDFLRRDDLANHETLAPFESDIYQVITEYLFEEYGREFTTDGTISNFDFDIVLTMTYFLVDDPRQRVIVSIAYKIEGDEIEITQIFDTPGIHFDEDND